MGTVVRPAHGGQYEYGYVVNAILSDVIVGTAVRPAHGDYE